MADGSTFSSPRITQEEIDARIGARVGGGNVQGQDFASWRYNQPIGDFGTAYPKSRRKMRMEAEFEKYQTEQLQQQRMMQQMESDQRNFELQTIQEQRLQRQQDFDFENAKNAEERESRVLNEAGMMIDSIRGAVGPDGKVIANPIRPEDPDSIERLDNLARNFKFGIENKAASSMFNQLYNDALKFRAEEMKQGEAQELAAVNLSVRTGKPFEEFGTYDERGIFKPRAQGMIAGAEEIKAAEEKKAQEAVISTEKRRAETTADVAEERNKIVQENKIQQDIRKATEDLRKMNATLSGKKLSDTQRNSLTAARDTLIDLEIEKAAIRNLAFEDQDAYQRAVKEGKKPPVGTLIYIGRKATKVK